MRFIIVFCRCICHSLFLVFNVLFITIMIHIGLFVIMSLCCIPLLCLISEREAFITNGVEYIYKYRSVIQSGLRHPSSPSSQWQLDAVLKIQVNNQSSIIQLTQINTSIYNGHLKDKMDVIPIEIPLEANELQEPFMIHYTSGYATSITVRDGESNWSVNIKRALASILQIDIAQLHLPVSVTQERTIHGARTVEYTVIHEDNHIKIRKFINHQDIRTAADFPYVILADVPHFVCSPQTPHQSSSSERIYLIRRVGNEKINVENIKTIGSVNTHPLMLDGESQYVLVNQSFDLQNSDVISVALLMNGKGKVVDLKYESYKPNLRDENKEQLIIKIESILQSLNENFEGKNFNSMKILQKTIPDLIYYLSQLDKNDLQKFFNSLLIGTSYQQETHRNLLLEILPKVGSKASVLFIRDLVLGKLVKDATSIKLLTHFPFHLTHLTEDIISEFEVLLKLDESICENVRRTAVLSFSNLIHKVCAHHCSPTTQELYVRQFVDLFSGSTTYDNQLLYLEALSNIELGNIFHYIKPIIEGNVTILTEKPHHIRFLGVWATMNQAPFFYEEVYQMYWPILTNRSEHLQMRIAACTMLLISGSSVGRFLNLFWYMKSDPSVHLKNFFYTSMVSLVESKFPCYATLSQFATLLIPYIEQPISKNIWFTGNYIIDYTNPKHNFGSLAHLFAVGNEQTGGPSVFYLQVNNHALGRTIGQMAIYLKMEGISPALKDLIIKGNTGLDSIKELKDFLKQAKVSQIPHQPVHVEIIIKNHGRVIFCKYINDSTFHELASDFNKLDFFTKGFHINYQTFDAPLSMLITQPTDMGTEAMLNIDSSSLLSFRGNFTQDHLFPISKKTQLDFGYSYMLNYTFSTYNPVLKMWHQVQRSFTYQFQIPFNNIFIINPSQWFLKFNVIIPNGNQIGIEVQLWKGTIVSGENVTEKMQIICASCKELEVIPNYNQFDDVTEIIKYEAIGVKVEKTWNNCEIGSYGNILSLLDYPMESNQNSRIFPLSKPFLIALHHMTYIYFVSSKSCNFKALITPLHKKEDTELEITFKLVKDKPQTVATLDSKFIFKLALTHKTGWQEPTNIAPLSNVDLTFTYDYSAAAHKQLMKIRVTHTAKEEKDMKICIDGEIINHPSKGTKYFDINTLDPFISSLTLARGTADGNKCPKDSITFQLNGMADIIDQKPEIIYWPFDKCLLNNLSSIKSCDHSSLSLGKFQKYILSIKYSNLPAYFARAEIFFPTLFQVLKSFSNKEEITTIKEMVNEILIAKLKPITNSNVSEKSVTIELSIPEPIGSNVIANNKKLHFKNLNNLLQPWLINKYFPLVHQVAINYGFMSMCVINTQKIRTFDKYTNSISVGSKYILLVADCTENPKFGILTKKTEDDLLSIKLYSGKNIIEVTPFLKGGYEIEVNGKSIMLSSPDEIAKIIKLSWTESGLVQVYCKITGIWLQHNGYFVVITLPDVYKGQVCGLCENLTNAGSNDNFKELTVL